jgi:hypothetical protein
MTSRRSFLTTAAGVAAGAAAAVPSHAIPVDPIYARIDAHAQSVRTVNTLHARLLRMIGGDMAVAEALCRSPETRAVQAALLAECAAGKALIETVPATRAGLKALEGYLRDDRSRNARWFIKRPITLDDGGTYTRCGDVDWLIARYAAAMA